MRMSSSCSILFLLIERLGLFLHRGEYHLDDVSLVSYAQVDSHVWMVKNIDERMQFRWYVGVLLSFK